MDNQKKRYWNVIKGIAVFLMLWGHCIQFCAADGISYFDNGVFKVIYSFHMPVFMVVSGYLFFGSCQRRDLRQVLIRRIQGMLQPIVCCTVFANVMFLLRDYLLSGKTHIFFGSLFQGISYSFWFLWAVLISSIAVAVAVKSTQRPGLQVLLTILGVLFVALFPQWDMSLFMYPFFVVGFFCAKYQDTLARVFLRFRYLALVIFPLMIPFYETKHYIYLTPVYTKALELGENLKIDFFRWAIGLAGSAFLLVLVDRILNCASGKKWLEKLLDGFAVLGMHSLQMYCLADVFLSGYLPHVWRKLMGVFGGNPFVDHPLLYSAVMTPLLAVAYGFFLYGLILLLRRTKLHGLLFGR